MDPDRRLLFDNFSLDVDSEQLSCSGDVVPLTPKAFAVLRRLVEDGGTVVTKEELLAAGWGKTHVSDGVLKVIILEIRRALGDDTTAPRFIETVPRRGYRFIARRTRPARMPTPTAARDALVGRERMLAQLDDRLSRAKTGQRQIVFVSGEAGIGKTVVLDAFRQRAACEPDLLLAHGACLEHYGAAEAYLPVLEALGRLVRKPGGDQVVRVLESHAPTWLAQLPWVEAQNARAALSREPLGITKERMLREMAEALEALTARLPLVLVLEDLHWSDYSTLDLLAMLARRQEAAGLLIIGSYRSIDVIVSQHPLRPLIQELRLRAQCEDIPLGFLREAHVAAYLAQRFGGHAFPSELALAVHQVTDGNPLFMVRVVDELVALRIVEAEDDRWRLRRPVAEIARIIPDSLRSLVEKQIDRLQPEAQHLLEAASVLGNEFTVASLAAGLDVDPRSIEDGCDALARQGQFLTPSGIWTRPDGTKAALYRFTHSLHPQAIAGRVPVGRRMRLHQRLAEWIQQTYRAPNMSIVSRLAWHFEEAGAHEQAIRYSIVTAENAIGRFAYGDAIRVLEHARSLVHHLAPQPRAQLDIELLQRIGDAHFGCGAMTECTEAYEAAADRADATGLTAARIEALSALVVPYGLIDPDRGIAAVEQAARLSADLGDALVHARTELLAASTRLMFDTWRPVDWQICESASKTIRALSDRGLPPYHRMAFAHLQMVRGDYADALANLDAERPNDNASARMMVQFVALSGKTLALLYAGRLGELARLLRAGKESAEKNGSDPWLFVFREAFLRTAIFDFAGARDLCDDIIAHSTAAYWHGQAHALGGIAAGYVALEQDECNEAARCFTRVLDPKRSTKCFFQWYWRLHAQLGLCNVRLASGDLVKARADAERFLQSALSTAEPNLQALAWDVGARVAMAEKDWKAAAAGSDEALAILRRFDLPTTAWRIHGTRADLRAQMKDKVAAEAERASAEAIILALASSFDSEDPLRHAFLAAPPIRALRSAQERAARRRARGGRISR